MIKIFFIKKNIIRFALVFMAQVFIVTPVCGEGYDIGEVVVSAPGSNLLKGGQDATGFATIIRPEELPSQVTSVPEVLDQAAGTTVRQYGGLGSFSTISIRGSSADQVAIYLDGVLLNTANSGVVNLSDIPLDNVEKIEIYRGTSPAKFAASGIGGVVNIVTQRAEKSSTASANYSFGSFDTHKANVYFSGKKHKYHYTLFCNRTQSEGDFEFKDNKGTRYNRLDDDWTHRRNNRFRSEEGLIKWGCDLPGNTALDLSFDLFNKKQGVPGIANFQSRDTELQTFRSLSHVRLKKEGLFVPELAMEILLSHSYQRQKFRDLKGEIGVGRQDNRDETESLNARLFFSWLLGRSQVISLLGEAGQESFQSRDSFASLGDPDGVQRVGYLYGFTEKAKKANEVDNKSDRQKRTTYTVSLEDEIYLFNDRLLLSPSVKFNWYDDDFDGKVPFSSDPVSGDRESYVTRKIGAAFKLCNGLEIRGNAGRYFRVPKMYELFGDRGAIVGNPDLDAERSFNWDLGFSIRLKPKLRFIEGFTFEYAWFRNDVDDLILFMQNSQRTSVAQNISKAEIEGHEFFWQIRFSWPIIISGNYTWQDARDKSNIAYWKDNYLPGRPRHQLFQRVEMFTDHFRLFHEFEYMNASYLDRANVREIDDRTFHHAGVSFSPKEAFVFTFEVKNIFDENEADVIGYPLPGRAFFGTVEVRF